MNTKWMNDRNSDNILLVEGSDDCNIIKKFCEDNSINKNSFGFCKCGADNKVLKKIDALTRTSGPENKVKIIGVILDADADIEARYKDIKANLEKYKLPADFPEKGLIVKQKDLPKLGIWIMPNNKDNGALEEFYLTITPNIDTDFIDGCIQEAQQKNLTSFKKQHRNKAIMHTHFAWQDIPGAPLHSAINKIALNNNHQIAKKFKTWLETLFG